MGSMRQFSREVIELISQTAEYALRAVVHLAMHAEKPQTTRDIARATHVPVPYLSKVLQSLGRAGLITSQRGLHGGSALVKSPADLTIFEVVDAVDPLLRIRKCPLGLESHGSNLCPLHRRLDDAMATVEKSFQSSTVLELISEPGPSRPLCAVRCADEVLSGSFVTVSDIASGVGVAV